MPISTLRIRPAQPSDQEACYHVCLKTSDSGDDGSHLFDDINVLGHIFVGPYLRYAPDLSWVLEDDDGVCGYVLGVVDTAPFFRWFETEWLPPIRAQYSEPTAPIETLTHTQRFIRELFHPDTYYPTHFHPYPAHMHIDLLPRGQGQGWGRRMTERLISELKKRGVPGMHLGTGQANQRAQAFYRKLGFTNLEIVGGCVYMARPL